MVNTEAYHNVPRNRRPGDAHVPNKSGESNKGKAKKEQKKKGLHKEHYIFIALLIAGSLFASVHFYAAIRGHHPAKPQIAKCLFDESAPFFVHCKDREQHNKDTLQHIVGSVKEEMDAESIADASVTLALAQTMRTRDIKLGKELYEYMRIALNDINCYKLIDVTSIDFQEETPRSICAAAVFRNEGEMDNKKALEAFNDYNDLIFLMAIYGSEFHEGTMRYTYESELITNEGEPVETPKFSAPAHNYYYHASLTKFPMSYNHLMNRLVEIRNNSEKERLGTTLLAIDLRKSLTAMRRCNPPANVTWMEYNSRAIFKRASNKDVEENCEWADAGDTLWEKVKNIYYDHNFRIRRMLAMEE